jgi:hypothetical protein
VVAAIGAVWLNASLAEVGNVLVSAVILGIGLAGFGRYRKQNRER